MMRMKKLIVACLVAMLWVASAFPALAKEASPVSLKDEVRKMAEAIVENYDVSGMQYAIMDQGDIVLSDGAGVHDRETQKPITKDSMFGIGSVSKMYSAAATMMLVDQGKIELDTPIVTYMKDFKMADERYKQITPRMLMNHSAGLFGTHYENSMLFDDNDTRSHDTLLQKMQTERLKSDPGEYSVYCNDCFQLLELLVEEVSGISYSDFLDQHVSTPLGLSSTKTPLDEFDRSQLAKTYFPLFPNALPVENANVIGAGGLYSTAEELLKFSEALIGDRTDVLSAESAIAMQQPENLNGVWFSDERTTFNYGLGWDAVNLAPFGDYGITALTKGGDTVMYHAALTALPEQHISIAVLSSGGSSFYNTIFASNVLQLYLKEKGLIKEIVSEPTVKAPVKEKMPSEWLAYEGLYGYVGGTVEIQIQDGEIEMPELLGMIPPQKYVYTGKGQFTSSDGSVVVSFDKQSNGHTYIKAVLHLNFPGIGQTRLADYVYQKLDTNPINETVKQAWEKRDGQTYFVVDEKYTSMEYLVLEILSKKIDVNLEHGYASGTRIVDANQALNVAEIPVMSGRDVFDFNFAREGQAEYLFVEGKTYISQDAVKEIYSGEASRLTIQPKGHAVWLKVGKSAGSTMSVELPKNGGFTVYDVNGMPVESSVATGNNTAVLPEDGFIVFSGDAGEVFKIRLEK